LSVLLDKVTPASVKALTAVTHPRSISEKSIGINHRSMGYSPSTTELEESIETTETTVVPAASPSIDLNALDLKAAPSADDNPKLYMLVDRLSGIVSDRNEAAAELLGDVLLLELLPSELLFLGRRLYRAASSLAVGGVDVFDVFRQERSLSNGVVNVLALGMFVELYFDDQLQLRQTPLEGPFTGLFELQIQPRFELCIRKLTDLLAPSKQLLFAVPSIKPTTVDLRIAFEVPVGSKTKLVKSLLCGGREILCEVEATSASALTSISGKDAAT